MNMLLSFVLVCCVLHVVSCLFVPTRMRNSVVNIEEPNEFCDEGPPGRYCLEDLSGWHDCHVERGEMVDTTYHCPSNTRCACFYGPPCPGSLENPCQPFRLPPPIQPKFTAAYSARQITCSPMGCKTFTYYGGEMQSLVEYKKRDDVHRGDFRSTFILPGNESGYMEYEVLWKNKDCQKKEIKDFPETSIPSYFSYNGHVKLDSILCDQWIWKTGGHNIGQPTTFTAYYMYNKTYPDKRYREFGGANGIEYIPLLLQMNSNSGPVGKTSIRLNITITEFLPQVVNETLFEVPSFCLP